MSSKKESLLVRSNYRHDIQILRGLAVMLVVVYHISPDFLPGGYIGVDIFFVISGFLITQHITREMREGGFSFASFYARRAARLLPASFFVLFVTLMVAVVVAPPVELYRILRDSVATALYVPNILFALTGTNYLTETSPSLFQHYWSLGLEEQFYLIWPIVLFLSFKLTKGSAKRVTFLLGMIAFISFLGGVVMSTYAQPVAFFSLPFRAWELAAGGLIAMIGTHRCQNIAARHRAMVSGVSVAGLAITAFVFDDQTVFPSYNALLPVVLAASVLYFGLHLLPRWLEPTAVWFERLGGISYSVYLVHWPLLVLPMVANSWRPVSQPLLWIFGAISIPLGWLLSRYVENIWRGKKFDRPNKFYLKFAGVSALGMAAFSLIILVVAQDRPLFIDQESLEYSSERSPVGAGFIGNNVSFALQDAKKQVAVPTGDNCHLEAGETRPRGCTYGSAQAKYKVALIGDSHAAQWFPALESATQQFDVELTTYTKDGCAIYDKSILEVVDERKDCKQWQQNVLKQLDGARFDLMLVTSSVSPEIAVSSASYLSGMRDALPILLRSGNVALLADTPRFEANPIVCLSANIEDPNECAIPRASAFNVEFREADERLSSEFGIPIVDLSDRMCSDVCYPMIDNQITFKDTHHISRSFSQVLTEPLLSRMMTVLAE